MAMADCDWRWRGGSVVCGGGARGRRPHTRTRAHTIRYGIPTDLRDTLSRDGTVAQFRSHHEWNSSEGISLQIDKKSLYVIILVI